MCVYIYIYREREREAPRRKAAMTRPATVHTEKAGFGSSTLPTFIRMGGPSQTLGTIIQHISRSIRKLKIRKPRIADSKLLGNSLRTKDFQTLHITTCLSQTL